MIVVAKKSLFLDGRKRAVIYLSAVLILSLLSKFLSPSEYYIMKKENVFNQFGTKFGWFWTCAAVTPFVLLTSFLHHGSYLKAARELTRLVIATFFWNFWTHVFVRIDHHTGTCWGASNAIPYRCADEGGSWISGFDISGHTFLLIYCSLIISEEAKAFYNWPASPRTTPKHIPSVAEYENFKKLSKWLQYWFVGLFLLQLFWDFQLIVTILYYHTLLSKFVGALVAVISWWTTYNVWFPSAFPFEPIRRHIKSF